VGAMKVNLPLRMFESSRCNSVGLRVAIEDSAVSEPTLLRPASTGYLHE
jgi:hypothetical protein